MKVTESMHLERTRLAANKVLQLVPLRATENDLVYRLAVARRFSMAYYAFMSYLIERLEVDQDTAESLTMEDILLRCRHKKVFAGSEEQYVMKMGMIYGVLSCYELEYIAITDELLKDVPQLATFLSQYCTLQGVVVPVQQKVVRRNYEYSV